MDEKIEALREKAEAETLGSIKELLRQNHLNISVPEYLRTMACVHLETGRRVLPRYVDDEVFRYAADEIERLESSLLEKSAEVLSLLSERDRLRAAAKALVEDVRARHPGEDLRCPFMIDLDAALRSET